MQRLASILYPFKRSNPSPPNPSNASSTTGRQGTSESGSDSRSSKSRNKLLPAFPPKSTSPQTANLNSAAASALKSKGPLSFPDGIPSQVQQQQQQQPFKGEVSTDDGDSADDGDSVVDEGGGEEMLYKYFDVQAQYLQPPSTSPYLTEPSRWQKFLNMFRRKLGNTRDLLLATGSSALSIRPSFNICIVGIHGWYPAARLVQTVFGEPEGTSEKFCQMMADAIDNSQFSKDYDVHLDQIAFTSHGRVLSRVKTYLDLISNDGIGGGSYGDRLRSADLIIFVTHSQGVPVSTILLSKLIRRGLVDTQRQTVGILCMAGIGHGPYPHLKDNLVIQYVETDAARELFDFCDGGFEDAPSLSSPSSDLSPDTSPSSSDSSSSADSGGKGDEELRSDLTRQFWTSMWICLECNVQMTCVGSWRDQVVPLYSALLTAFHHPNILRAVYIDHFNYHDDFLTRLIVFLIRIRNLGISDHNLLVHLSPTLTGSLYQGTAHSTIYDEPKVYSLAFSWILRQRMVQMKMLQPTARITRFLPFKVRQKDNPYFIPWAMRRLADDPIIKSDQRLSSDLKSLFEQYRKWTPVSKSGRDLRYRLEPLLSYRHRPSPNHLVQSKL